MRRSAALLLLVLALVACDARKAKPLTIKGEKLYTVDGKILGRNPADNSLRLDHKEIPGFMEAMTMDYPVRGADVKTLPPDQSRVTAKLHVTDTTYWLTDVKPVPAAGASR
jgi:Copper binding periplasmic protein CusF